MQRHVRSAPRTFSASAEPVVTSVWVALVSEWQAGNCEGRMVFLSVDIEGKLEKAKARKSQNMRERARWKECGRARKSESEKKPKRERETQK